LAEWVVRSFYSLIRKKGKKVDHVANNRKNNVNDKVIWVAAALVATLLLVGEHGWQESAIRAAQATRAQDRAKAAQLGTTRKAAPPVAGRTALGATEDGATQEKGAAKPHWGARRAEADRIEREAIAKLTPSQKEALRAAYSKARDSAQKVRDDNQTLWALRDRLGLAEDGGSHSGPQPAAGMTNAAAAPISATAFPAGSKSVEPAAKPAPRRPWGIYCLFTDV